MATDLMPDAAPPAVTVYTTGPACVQCMLTESLLADLDIPFVECDITRNENSAARDYVVGDLGYTRAPVVVLVHHVHREVVDVCREGLVGAGHVATGLLPRRGGVDAHPEVVRGDDAGARPTVRPGGGEDHHVVTAVRQPGGQVPREGLQAAREGGPDR